MIIELSRVLTGTPTDEGYSQLVTFTAGIEPTAQELREEFNSKCTHDYDGCSCVHFRVDITSIVKYETLANTYTVQVDATRNI